MGKITITYSKIKDAAKNSEKVANYYGDFSSELNDKVYSKLNIGYGSDSKGYISSAKNTVYNKIKDLNSKKTTYTNLSKSLYDLQERIEICENNAKNRVSSIAESALELKNRKWYQKVADWIYGTVCVDILNSNPLTRGLGNLIKSGLDYLDYKFDKAIDWFKHGNGRYILNIALSVIGDIAAIAGTVHAIVLCVAATVATGGVAAPLLIAAIASGIGTIMTLVDSGTTIYNNVKALKISKESNDPGRARYYGNIGGLSDTMDKYDLGDEKKNNRWEGFGKGYDVVHNIADITSVAAGSVGKAGLVKETHVVAGKTYKFKFDYSAAKDNLKNSFLENLGFRKNNGKYTFKAKNLFNMKGYKSGTVAEINKIEDGVLRIKFGNRNSQAKKVLEAIDSVGAAAKKPVKINSVINNTENIISGDSNLYEKGKSAIKIITGTGDLSGSKWGIISPLKDIDGTVIKTIDTIIDVAS